MDPVTAGALISAGSKIIGGFLGNKSAEKQAAQNFERNAALQKEFAQSGIQWRVEDAKKAGIHPLYAVGANTPTYTPVSSVGGTDYSFLGSAGQDIGRAVNATRSESARQEAYTATVQDLSVKKMKLENDLLASQVAKINASMNPPMPSAGDRYLVDGQAQSGLVKTGPLKRQASAPGALSQEAGAVNSVGYMRTATGLAPVRSRDATDRLDDDTIGNLIWNVNNRLKPSLGWNYNPPAARLPKGYNSWYYDPATQEYRPSKSIGNKYLRFHYYY